MPGESLRGVDAARRGDALGRSGARTGGAEPAGETLVAYAAKEGTVAVDREGRNSPYSEALLRYLEEPGLEVGLMFRKVRDAVLASTGGRQEPFVYGSLSSREAYLTARPVLPDSPSSTDLLADSQSATYRLAAERLAAERLSREEELLFWESVKDSKEAAELHAYLGRYPSGAYEALARIRLKRLEGTSDGSEPPESTDSAAQAQEAFSVPVPAETIEPTEATTVSPLLEAISTLPGPTISPPLVAAEVLAAIETAGSPRLEAAASSPHVPAETIGPTEEVTMRVVIDPMALMPAPGMPEAQQAKQAPEADDETGAPPSATDHEGYTAGRVEYLARLRHRLSQYLRYPSVARERRQTGTALLRIAVDRTGSVQELELRASTGHALLDREALEVIERAQPLPALPEYLRREHLEVLLNIEFVLN